MSAAAPRHDPDVLVIGGGVAGLFCAYHLRRRGGSVAVVERGPIGGPQSCSSGNTGFVGTQGAAPLAEPGVPAQGLRWLLNPESPFYVKPRLDRELLSWLWHFRRACNPGDARAGFGVLLELKKRSLEILREVCGSATLAATFTERGMVVAFKTAQGFEKACRSTPHAVANGVPLRVLSPAELRALEPGVEFDIHGALYNEEGAYLRVPDFIREFARTLAGMGVELHPHTDVAGFDVTGRTVTGVRTAGGDFRPHEVIIAAGAWSAECARALDVGLMLQPAKGYAITVPTPRNAPRLPVLLSEGKVAISPLGDRLRFGGTLELSGMDGVVSRRRVDGIMRTVRAYLPRLERTEVLETWSGLRPCTPDSLPFLGRARPYRNLCIASGHGHIGLGLAPAGGKLIAQIVAGERPDVDVAPFRVDRYARRTARSGGGGRP
jgi:D-amino-acid dehydrogenase